MTQKLEPLARCCSEHPDWQTLAEHLRRDFPSVSNEQVLRSVLEAQSETQRFDLRDQEALEVGELIVRYRLLVSIGEIPDVARTDPQTHHVGGAAGEAIDLTAADGDLQL